MQARNQMPFQLLPPPQVEITGSFIVGLVWTIVVSMILFGLTGCSSGAQMRTRPVGSICPSPTLPSIRHRASSCSDEPNDDDALTFLTPQDVTVPANVMSSVAFAPPPL